MQGLNEAELEAKHPRWFRHMVKMIERYVPEIGTRPRRKVSPKRRRLRKKKRRRSRKKKQNLMDMVLADLKSNVAPRGYKRLGHKSQKPARLDQMAPGPWAPDPEPFGVVWGM